MKKLLVLLSVFFISAPSYAFTIYENEEMNFDFYGSIRAVGNLTYEVNTAIDSAGVAGAQSFSTDIPFKIQNNSRFGFKFGYKQFKAVLEMALSTEVGTTDPLRFRLAYVQYDVNDKFGFSIGKMSLAPSVASGNVFRNDTLSGYGGLSASRRGAVQVAFYGVEFNIVSLDSYTQTIENMGGNNSKLTNSLPSVLIAYNLPKVVKGKVWAQYLNAIVEDSTVPNSVTKTTLQSWITGFHIAPKFSGFTILASAYIGENVGFLASSSGAIAGATPIDNDEGSLINSHDSLSMGFLIAPRYAINNSMSVEIGYGMASANVYGLENKEDSMSAYFVYKYKPIKYLTIAAEVLYLSLKATNSMKAVKKTETIMAGIQARFDF